MKTLTVALALALGGCGVSSTTVTSTTGSCCLNGAYYACPTAEDATKCSLSTGPGTCTRNSARDSSCN